MPSRRGSWARRGVAMACAFVLPLVVLPAARAASGDIAAFAGGPGRGAARTVSQLPTAVVSYGTNVYVADDSIGVIRRINTTTGYEDVVAGDWQASDVNDTCGPTGLLSEPDGLAVAVDGNGNLFFTITLSLYEQIHQVCRMAPNGTVTVVAGGGSKTGNNVPATEALVRRIMGLAVDAAGNLYIAENHFNVDTAQPDMSRVRRVDPTGVIRAFAGSGAVGFFGDGGAATAARLAVPNGLAVEGQGAVYIADTYNNRIRKVAGGVINTVAGNGIALDFGDGGSATLAALSAPQGVHVDATGNLFIADTGNFRVRKVTPNGVIHPFAGDGTKGFKGDGGPATKAWLANPVAVTKTNAGVIWIADHVAFAADRVTLIGARLRTVSGGIIQTGAGNGAYRHSSDGASRLDAEFDAPFALTFDAIGRLVVADGRYIRRINLGSKVVTLAGGKGTGVDSGDEGPATAANVGSVNGVAFGPNGDLYFSEGGAAIRRIDTNGVMHHIAGNNTCCGSEDNVPAATTSVTPHGIAVDALGNIWFNDVGTAGLREIDTAGIVHNIPGTVFSAGPTAIDKQGRVLFGAYFDLKRYDPVAHTVTRIAGTGQPGSGGDGGPAVAASFSFIGGLAVGSDGSIYVSDFVLGTVRKIDSDGIIDTIAGQTGQHGYSGDGGPATSALLDSPLGLALDAAGNLYISDNATGRIRRVAA